MRSVLHCCMAGSLVLALLNPAYGEETNGKPAGSTADAGQPHPASNIEFKDGQISVKAKNIPIGLLANELSHKAGIAIIVTQDVGNQLVSLDFKQRPLDEGVRQVFAKQDCFFFYGVDGDQPSSLKAVWVYAKGKGRGLQPVAPEKWASTKDLSANLSNKDPGLRGQAVETLIERKGNDARDVVLNAMHDSNTQVRSRALYAALRSGVDMPETMLNDLAVTDSSPDIRFLALQALSDRSDARSVAERALKDPDEAVRSEAQQILGRLKEAQAAQSPVQPPPGANQPQQEPQ
jgi:HEAT repeat protein